MKRAIKKILPKSALFFYHLFRAHYFAWKYGFPSEKMVIIGITGTKGKSSAANFIWAAISGAGLKTGLLGTANIRIGAEEMPNTFHMTMPGPRAIQGLLRRMADSGCQVAVVETTSEGIVQFRHVGINYDFLIFTNLTPEHIKSHGSFLNYRTAKQTIFKNLNVSKGKSLLGMEIPKVIIANLDSPECANFLKFKADKKITYSIKNSEADFYASRIKDSKRGVSFVVSGKGVYPPIFYKNSADFKKNNREINNNFSTEYIFRKDRRIKLKIAGAFNVWNALPAFAVGKLLGLEADRIIHGLEELQAIPGRMEIIQDEPFTVIVDYAHEKESLTALLDSIKNMNNGVGKIILLLGAEGGGRDASKRAEMGQIGAKEADILVVANVDPYDEDPRKIMEDIARSAESNGKITNKDLFLVEDRAEAIKKAVSLAKTGDFVLITGKGSEQSFIIGNKRIPWDDRLVVKKALEESNPRP